MDAFVVEEEDVVERAVDDVEVALSVVAVVVLVEAAGADIVVERQRQQDASLAAAGAVVVVAAVVSVPFVLVAFSLSSYLYCAQVAANVALTSLHRCIHQMTSLIGIDSPLIFLPFEAVSSTNLEARWVCVASTSGQFLQSSCDVHCNPDHFAILRSGLDEESAALTFPVLVVAQVLGGVVAVVVVGVVVVAAGSYFVLDAAGHIEYAA